MGIKPGLSDHVEWMRPLGVIIKMGSRRFLEDTYLPLDDDLTVLYGVNGAGKSFVLESVTSCYSGLRAQRHDSVSTFLLAQLPEGKGNGRTVWSAPSRSPRATTRCGGMDALASHRTRDGSQGASMRQSMSS